jgi:hypothetical protein
MFDSIEKNVIPLKLSLKHCLTLSYTEFILIIMMAMMAINGFHIKTSLKTNKTFSSIKVLSKTHFCCRKKR